MTLARVAEVAGVSIATASRVLNGSTLRTVRGDLQERVMLVAADLGYTPNAHAQAMARGSSTIIGLIVNDISDPYFSTIAAGVMRVAEGRGIVVLGSTRNQSAQELEYVTMLRVQRAKALVIVGSRTTDANQTKRLAAEVAAFQAAGGRVSVVSQNRLGADTVMPENRAGAHALAVALVEAGHRSFAVLGGPPTLVVATDRVKGFSEGVAAAGLPVQSNIRVIPGDFTRDGGYAAAGQLLDDGPLPDCIFAVNDVMAMGAMAALRERGCVVPRDVGVAGFDDIPTLRDIAPALTTVRLPLVEMGERAGSMALDATPGQGPRLLRIRGEVALRESTRRMR
ncbi:MAG TPA: LacI family DNA-binding transcriptional regulator [Kineosporiaceae bacterium]|nr:LacI family DNA-binding transcriptional regulator [Kineosporiaceae bacterium]